MLALIHMSYLDMSSVAMTSNIDVSFMHGHKRVFLDIEYIAVAAVIDYMYNRYTGNT